MIQTRSLRKKEETPKTDSAAMHALTGAKPCPGGCGGGAIANSSMLPSNVSNVSDVSVPLGPMKNIQAPAPPPPPQQATTASRPSVLLRGVSTPADRRSSLRRPPTSSTAAPNPAARRVLNELGNVSEFKRHLDAGASINSSLGTPHPPNSFVPRRGGVAPADYSSSSSSSSSSAKSGAPDNAFKGLMNKHMASTNAMKDDVKKQLNFSLKHLQDLNFGKLAELENLSKMSAQQPALAAAAAAAGSGTVPTSRAEMRRAMLDALEGDLKAEGSSSSASTDPMAAINAMSGRSSGKGVGDIAGSADLVSQIAQFKTQLGTLGTASQSFAAAKGPTLAPPAAGVASAINMIKNVAAPTAGGPDMSSLQAQQAVLSVLQSQLGNWQEVASKFGALNGVINNFGTTVRYFTNFTDDARHYTPQTSRGALLPLLDADSERWYRENESSQAMVRSNSLLTWVGANAAPKSDTRKRFQLEFSDMLVDDQHRAIVVGKCYNPDTQLTTMCVGRFTADGTQLDPTFAKKPGDPTQGWMQTEYFSQRSDATRVLFSLDRKRLLVLGSVFDQASQQMSACICAVQPDNSLFDEKYGDLGVTGVGVGGYKGSLGISFDVHPVTGDMIVLIRLQKSSDSSSGGRMASLFLKVRPDGTIDDAFTPVFVGAEKTVDGSIWLATDIAWRVGANNLGDRTQDRIVVTGTLVQQIDDQSSRAFVWQYLGSDGSPDTNFGDCSPDADNGATGATAATLQEYDLTRVLATGASSLAAATEATTLATAAAAAADAATDANVPLLVRDTVPIKPPPPTTTTITTTSGSGGGDRRCGLIMVQVDDAATNVAMRVLSHDGILDIAGIAYPTLSAVEGFSFLMRVNADGTQTVHTLRVPGCQTTVIQDMTFESDSGTRTLVGYCLRNAWESDSGDCCLIRVKADNTVTAFRLPMHGEFFQTVNAVTYDPAKMRLVSAGTFQTGRTTFTRVAFLLSTLVPPPPSSTPPPSL
jgi:hypothetical protein